MADEIGRREFVKHTVAGTVLLTCSSAAGLDLVAAGPVDANNQVVAALGSTFIPSAPDDPGYKELESHGITEFVMQKLQVADDLGAFNNAAEQFFGGKPFLELDEKQREEYLALIADGSKIADVEQRIHLQAFYRAARA